MVVNKHRDYKARLDYFTPARVTHPARLVWHYEFPYDQIERIHAEVKQAVKPMGAVVSKIENYVAKLYTRNTEETPVSKISTSIKQWEHDHKVTEEELNSYGFKFVTRKDGTFIVPMNDDEKKAEMAKQLKEGLQDGGNQDELPFGNGFGATFID